jgi:integrase/recombinase XerD
VLSKDDRRSNEGPEIEYGWPPPRSQFFRIFQACAEAASLPPEKRHPHALKHSLATHLIAGNVNLALVKQSLGHRSISSTVKYVSVSDRQASQVAQAALMGLY